MVDVERAQEVTMWVVVLASAVLAAARFATYLSTVRLTDVPVEVAVAWWATYAIAIGLIVVGLLGQRSARRRQESSAWLALLVGFLVLVLMPTTPAGAPALGLWGLLARPT